MSRQSPTVVRIDASLVARLYREAQASRWGVSEPAFTAALERSAAKALPDRPQDRKRLERYLTSLHLEDLALACACAEGHEAAWDHFVLEYRPVLYRSADAIDPGGGARELADSIYADLFGLQERDGERRSLLRYFHGRSSLSTWLRAVLAQRQVDRVRSTRRLTPLEDEEGVPPALVSAPSADPDSLRFAALTGVIERCTDDSLKEAVSRRLLNRLAMMRSVPGQDVVTLATTLLPLQICAADAVIVSTYGGQHTGHTR